jgi:GT2 family glycosyltransferase
METLNPKYILLLNNDTEIVQEDWLRRLIEIAESDEKIGIVGCKLIYPDGRVQSIGVKVNFLGVSRMAPNNYASFPKLFEVDAVLGACLLINTRVIERVGLLDEIFSPFQHEETDFCLRAKSAGYKVLTYLDIVIIHIFNVSMKKVNREYYDFMNTKNEIMLVLLNFSPLRVIEYAIFGTVFKLLVCLFKKENDKTILRKNAGNKLKVFFSAWLANLKNITPIKIGRKNRNKVVLHNVDSVDK